MGWDGWPRWARTLIYSEKKKKGRKEGWGEAMTKVRKISEYSKFCDWKFGEIYLKKTYMQE